MSIWIPSPNRYVGRIAPLKWVVWHSTEGVETTGAALALALNWFALPSANVSAHIVADDGSDDRYGDGIIECVQPSDTAWHCANGNASGYGVEIVGKAGQTGVQWTDRYSLEALHNAARWVADHPALQHIPRRWLTDDQLRRGELGHITHVQVSRVLGGTNHSDPGPNFPYDLVMAYLNEDDDMFTDADRARLAATARAVDLGYARDQLAAGIGVDGTVDPPVLSAGERTEREVARRVDVGYALDQILARLATVEGKLDAALAPEDDEEVTPVV